MPAQWQIRFDDGHQQRYLPDRQAVLRYVLAVGPRAGSPRFEVFRESDPVVLGDGSPGGRVFTLVEIIDLARPGEVERLRTELAAVAAPLPNPQAQGAQAPDAQAPDAQAPGTQAPGTQAPGAQPSGGRA